MSLPCRLLCACNLTYSVTGNGTLAAVDPYSTGSGLTTTPVGFVDPSGIHSGLVGTFTDGVFIAFRGTLPPNDNAKPLKQKVRDWVNDFRAVLVESPNIPGKVHKGFQDALVALWPAVKAEAQKQLSGLGGTSKLYITGHSKGGGIASLAAMRWFKEMNSVPQTVTFEAPKVGNRDFHDAIDSAKLPIDRYEFQDDFVPHLPPSSRLLAMLETFVGEDFTALDDFNYEHVGRLQFINWSNNLETPTDVLREFILNSERLGSIVRLVADGNFEQIVNDHRIGCGSECIKAICDGGVCP